MRKSILIIAALTLSLLNANAMTSKSDFNTAIKVLEITNNNIIEIFEWQVETIKGNYSGTSLSLESAKKMIALSSAGELVKGTEITSYFVLKSEIDNTQRNYFWEVETASGKARGYSSTEAYAHKMIQLVASGDAIVEKIIISQPQL